jgi:hypothetical protein
LYHQDEKHLGTIKTTNNKEKKMSEMCWDQNPDCMAIAEGDTKRPCPAYEQKIGCWELDWQVLMQKATEEQKKEMGQWMKEKCPKCPVYNKHQNELDQKISSIN